MDPRRSTVEGPAGIRAAGPFSQQPLGRRALLATGLAGSVVAASAGQSVSAATPGLRFSSTPGAGDVPLNVVEAGRRDGPEILFLHGMSQSYLSWEAQFNSALADRFRLVAFDLRGHGNSGKPWRPQDYAGSRIWADDVAAVVAAAGLKRPTLVAWSFGGAVAMDYVRHYGSGGLTAINMVGNLGGLVDMPPNPSKAFEAIWAEAPLRQSSDIAENIDGFRRAADTLSAHLTQPQKDLAFATGMMQTGVVRRALAGKTPIDNKALAKAVACPVLIAVGTLDLFTPVAAAHAAAAVLPQARVSVYDDVGHFVSAEAPARFNRELAALASSTHS